MIGPPKAVWIIYTIIFVEALIKEGHRNRGSKAK